jgi:hypothetical protein
MGWYAGRANYKRSYEPNFRLVAVIRRNGFSFHAERSTRFVQRSRKRGLSPTGDRHSAVSHFSKTKTKNSYTRLTADFFAPFFALLFPLPMSALAAR